VKQFLQTDVKLNCFTYVNAEVDTSIPVSIQR
jgi:hypothetical protein